MDTSFLSEINWIAVFCAAFAYFGLGAFWYSKLLFVNAWLKMTGIDVNSEDAKKGVGATMGFSFICMLLICAGLSILRYRLDLQGSLSGLKLGLFTGLIFSTAIIAINYLYEKKPIGLLLINGGYALVGQIVAAMIICTWF